MLRWQYSPKQPVDSMKMLIKISTFFFINGKLILKFMQNCKGPQITNTILKKRSKVGGLTLLDFKIYTKL